MYAEGSKFGLWKSYYSTGTMHTIGHFEKGDFEGIWTVYWPDGKMKQIGEYHQGYATGRWCFFNESGGLKRSGNFENDIEVGVWFIHENVNIQYYDFDNEEFVSKARFNQDKACE